MAPTSRARRLSAVRQLFKFLSAEGVVEEDPALGFAGPEKGWRSPRR
jgi:integrase/recombinase XerD